jgi:hypothetical protein
MRKSSLSLLYAGVAAAALAIASPALAAAPGANTTAPGVVNVSIGGNGGNVSIQTFAPYVNDTLTLNAPGAFSVDQSNRFTSVGQYTGDGNDIDRVAAFNGLGTVTAVTNYQSTDPYAVANAQIYATLSADANGGLQQNLTFDQNHGGVFTQDQWKKQRSMQLSVGGNYSFEVADTGASLAPSLSSMPVGPQPGYSADINGSAAGGTANLLFSPGNGNQALSNNGDHGQYTGVSLNAQLDYTGSPVMNVTGHTVISGTIGIVEQAGTVLATGTVH